ncbi:glucosamine-6-phosphate isomerase [Thamnidium elegans]|uniref:Glucosamine-6-phosphate isomerase n=1 Tax=Thamnidium elegans TaxID=101142 RepID=A0A8H7SN08_9FUNG|nr:hypothetical protein INT48_006545 [Thamnidium elegans]KAI8080960.1 glucosamine-6-phosphate isomerase [Thamnidium elegans]
MRLVIRNDYDDVSAWIAHYIKERINQFKPTEAHPFVLGLPSGSSPILLFKRLIEFYKAGEISFKHVVTFNMDEYIGIPKTHKESYYTYTHTHFFKNVDIQKKNINLLNGNASDLEAECRRYERKIIRVGGIELFLCGVGPDGHFAFNEPGSSLKSRTRIKTLAYESIVANSRFFSGDISKVPKAALTVGVATVMDAREVCIIITGAHKSVALAKCIEEGVNHMWTVSAIQMHAKALIVCDEDATMELHVKTVKYFKSIEQVHRLLIGKANLGLQGELLAPEATISKSSHEKGHQLFIRHLLDSVSVEDDDDDTPRLKKRRR